jgi:hypothetical protein
MIYSAFGCVEVGLMDPLSPLRDDALLSASSTIAINVNRSSLQQILVESRLMPREATRDELRRVSPGPAGWMAFVKERLLKSDTRPAALRALSSMTAAYIGGVGVDHRVETAFRKARQAAERGDLERVHRELSKLATYATELSDVGLQHSPALLYLFAASERARVCPLSLVVNLPGNPRAETDA